MDEIPPAVPGYRLTRLLGRGATSTVWRARRESDDELVAIKLVPAAADDEAVREFSMLQHAAAEHVVAFHESVEVMTDEGSATALVLEHLAGGSLARVVAERGHLSAGETVTIIAPVAQAVTGLHDLGIVHGDLSPGNVLLHSTGRPVLADLGCSRLTGEAPGDVYGTDGLVAPEVLEGEEPSRASDVHALGALAWLCLTGSAPGHIAERSDLIDLLPDEPRLVEIVESCLATDPAARPEADEVARDVFDAVAAQPLQMTATGDVASSLTRRIREAAAEDVVSAPEWQGALMGARPPQEARRWWRHRTETPVEVAPPRVKGGRHAARRRRDDEPIDLTRDVTPEGAEVDESRSIARSALAGADGGRRPVVLATLALAAVLAVVVPWQQLASADGDAPAQESAAAAPASAVQDRAAPRAAPTRLVQELTAMRREMILDLDPSAVSELDEEGSSAATRDRELLDGLRDRGERYRGITMTVRSAQVQSASGPRAVVRSVVDVSAYEVVGADGARSPQPARRGQPLDLVLVWRDGAWRVRDVVAP